MKRIFAGSIFGPALLLDTDLCQIVTTAIFSERRWRFRHGQFKKRTVIITETIYRTANGRYALTVEDDRRIDCCLLGRSQLKAWVLKRCPAVEVALQVGAFVRGQLVEA